MLDTGSNTRRTRPTHNPVNPLGNAISVNPAAAIKVASASAARGLTSLIGRLPGNWRPPIVA
jgi:hypothetical protein